MTKVLFISQWYPHRNDAMFGLFVRKHAEAVARFCEVQVLYIQSDTSINRTEIVQNRMGNLTETIVYYPESKAGWLKLYYFIKSYLRGYKLVSKNGFIPDIVHVNILTRTGCIAYLLKKFKGIPYVITEHWSRYLPERKAFHNVLHRLITRLVVSNSEAVLPVSEVLKSGMFENGLTHPRYQIISNVVDDFFCLNQGEKTALKIRLLHISCFDDKAKNIIGILRAVSELFRIRNDFELIIIGTGIDFKKITDYSKSLGLDESRVQFIGEKTPEEVAEWYNKSDVVVQFSNYETAGLVVAEALVCGVPVISTRVGIAPQYIDDTNGKLIAPGDETALLEAMNEVMNNTEKYNKMEIARRFSDMFSYNRTGATLSEFYAQILHKNAE